MAPARRCGWRVQRVRGRTSASRHPGRKPRACISAASRTAASSSSSRRRLAQRPGHQLRLARRHRKTRRAIGAPKRASAPHADVAAAGNLHPGAHAVAGDGAPRWAGRSPASRPGRPTRRPRGRRRLSDRKRNAGYSAMSPPAQKCPPSPRTSTQRSPASRGQFMEHLAQIAPHGARHGVELARCDSTTVAIAPSMATSIDPHPPVCLHHRAHLAISSWMKPPKVAGSRLANSAPLTGPRPACSRASCGFAHRLDHRRLRLRRRALSAPRCRTRW